MKQKLLFALASFNLHAGCSKNIYVQSIHFGENFMHNTDKLVVHVPDKG